MRKPFALFVLCFTALAWCAPAHAQIAHKTSDVSAKGSSTGVTTRQTNTGGTSGGFSVAVGDLVIVGVGGASTTITVTSVTDTAGNTYVQGAGCRNTTTGGGNDFTDIWYTIATAANSANKITAHYSASLTFDSVGAVAYTGADAAPFEMCATAAIDTSTPIASGSFSPAASGNVNFVIGRNPGGGVSSFTAGSGYASRITSTATVTFFVEDKVASASGAQTAGYSWAGGAASNKLSVASFKQDTGGGGGGSTASPQQMMTGVGD